MPPLPSGMAKNVSPVKLCDESSLISVSKAPPLVRVSALEPLTPAGDAAGAHDRGEVEPVALLEIEHRGPEGAKVARQRFAPVRPGLRPERSGRRDPGLLAVHPARLGEPGTRCARRRSGGGLFPSVHRVMELATLHEDDRR